MLRSSWMIFALVLGSMLVAQAADPPKQDSPSAGAESPAKSNAAASAVEKADVPPAALAKPDAPQTDAPATESAPEAPSAAETAAMAKFDAAFAEWNKLIEEMHATQLAYKSAKPSDREPIRHKFEDLTAQGDKLQPKLLAAAQAAYEAAPNKHEPVSNVILSLIAQDLRDGKDEEALRLSRLLIANKYPNARVYDLAGVAAFHLDDFPVAEEFLKQAERHQALSITGTNILASMSNKVMIVRRDIDEDRYEQALRRARALFARGIDTPELYNLAGIAAYQTNDFDAAEKYFASAKEKKALDPRSYRLLDDLPKSKQLWETEQALREKEAQADDLPRVELKTTKGTIVIELFENEAPNTVANFINLVEKKYYNNLTFHRVINGFMAQGGDPQGTGFGGPGYTIECECYEPDARKHFRGSISMAHAGRDTGGSQFFITFRRTPELDDRHTVFGRVIEGMDVLAKLQRRNPEERSGRLPDPDRIIEAKVLRKRDHKYEPVKIESKDKDQS